jgi:hypothetical protein
MMYVLGPPPFADETWVFTPEHLIWNAVLYYQCSLPHWLVARQFWAATYGPAAPEE